MVAGPLLGKRVYLDANPLIYAFESPKDFPQLATHFLGPLQKGELTVVTSTVTITEVLTHPIKNGDAVLEQAYRQFFAAGKSVEIWPVNTEIAERAAQLRAQFGLRTPDAIHIATSLIAKCDLFFTHDLALGKLGIRIISPGSL
jgi:predicted nucleic acid-binding protein